MKKNYNFLIPYFFIVLVILLVFSGSVLKLNAYLNNTHGKFIGKKAYDFKLKDSHGNNISLSDLHLNKFILLTFGFTKCTGVCPQNLYRFRKLSQSLGAKELTNIEFVFISIDKYRDSPEELEIFLNVFNIKNSTALISGKDDTLNVAYQFHSYVGEVKEKMEAGEQIEHAGEIFLIDPKGTLLTVYSPQTMKRELLVEDIEKFQKEY